MKNYSPTPGKLNNPRESKKEEAIENIKNAISELDFKNPKKAEEFLQKALIILSELQ